MSLLPGEKRVVSLLIYRRLRRLGARQDIYVEGDTTSAVRIMLDGWACRYYELADGRRQIVQILLPGDVLGHDDILYDRHDHSACSISPITFAQLPFHELEAAAVRFPRIREGLRWDLTVSAAIHRQWLRSLGRLDATQRVGHLLCELYLRVALASGAAPRATPFPLSQRDIADCLGLSTVQVNRSLKNLRSAGLIGWRNRILEVVDLQTLSEMSAFRPDYLNLKGEDDLFAREYRGGVSPRAWNGDITDLPLFR